MAKQKEAPELRCPMSKEPRSWCPNCLAYQAEEHSWKETQLVEDPEQPGKMTEVYTGNILTGVLCSCKMGILSREVVNQQLVGKFNVETGEPIPLGEADL